MNLILAFALLVFVTLLFLAPIGANELRRRHHDHLIPGHPRSPR
jgi:hypothetical protein